MKNSSCVSAVFAKQLSLPLEYMPPQTFLLLWLGQTAIYFNSATRGQGKSSEMLHPLKTIPNSS